MADSKREKIAAMMKDPDWVQRWPRGPQRREAIEAHLAEPTQQDAAPEPLTLESTQPDQPVKAKKKRRKQPAQDATAQDTAEDTTTGQENT